MLNDNLKQHRGCFRPYTALVIQSSFIFHDKGKKVLYKGIFFQIRFYSSLLNGK